MKSFIPKIIIICLLFAAGVSINSDSLNSIALYVAIPLAFILSFMNSQKIAPNKYVALLFLLYLWDAISVLWANYATSASRELHRVLGAVLLIYIMAENGKQYGMLKYLYLVFIILYASAWYYTYNNSLIVSEMLTDADRLNDEKLNANTMAYYTFYATFGLYLLPDLIRSRKGKKLINLLFLLMIPISFCVAIFTASRQVLIIQIPLISFLLYERYLKEASFRKRTIFAICAIGILVTLIPIALSIYNNSYLAVRAEKNLQEDTRWFLLLDAINVGLDHFPFGVGAGNYINYSYNQHFSHCSFTELFANNGIIGLFLYCYFLFFFIKQQWIRYKTTSDRKFIVFMVFGLIFSFDQLFYVFYIDLWLISFFVLICTHSDTYFNNLAIESNNDNK